MKLNNPKALKIGDTIAIVAPSSGLANLFPHRVKQGEKMLKKLGFNVIFSKHSLDIKKWTSAPPQDRANDLHTMFKNKDVKAIICSIGGNYCNQLLKYLNFDLIKNNPKIFLGYSDITILHHAFAKKARLRTFYGPCLISEFGEYPEIPPYTSEYFKKGLVNTNPIGNIEQSETWTDEFLDWFQKEDLQRSRNMQNSKGYEWWKEGTVEGEIWGGAIPTITYLAGTEYWVDPKNLIFFIDIPEGDIPGKKFNKSWLDAFLSNMDNLKIFSSIKGLIIGRPYNYSQEDSDELKEMINYYTKDYNYPILYNANIGHTSPIITLPMGVNVKLDSKNNKFRILESGVK